MREYELTEARGGSLYHSMDEKYIVETLRLDRILGTSIHRYDDSGKLIFDPELHGGWLANDPAQHWYRDRKDTLADPNVPERAKRNIHGWEASNWYVGVSMTRSPTFAGKWKDVVLELDQSKLVQRYRIAPKAWGSTRREAEEFLILKDNAREYVDSKAFRNPNENAPKVAPLSKYLTGLYIGGYDKRRIELGKGEIEPSYRTVMNHPLYKGFL